MEGSFMLKDIILLFERYSPDSRRLHESFLRAGCECSAVVLEEDDFLPEGVMSVYDIFLGYREGKPKFFNEVPVPDHWSISAGIEESRYGKITWQHEEKGRIHYWENAPKKWLVKAVDWLDRKGIVRCRDHYNSRGSVYARTVYDKEGKECGKTWFSVSGQEVITGNAITGDLIVNDGGMIRFFRTKMDMMLYFFSRTGIERKHVFYNTLSIPFLLAGRFQGQEKRDMLFWQEDVGEGIPGNMQFILDGHVPRTDKIIVQKRSSYHRLVKLGVDPDRMRKLGYLYEFKKENGSRRQALICTNSDEIEHCEELIRALPQMQFHIAALTLMSPKLMGLEKYDNVKLYPGVQEKVLDKLFMECDYYFDINHWAEIVSAVYRAFLHEQLIFAFEETVHNREFVADRHIYPAEALDRMISDIRRVMGDAELMKAHLKMQHDDAMVEEKEAYISLVE